MKKIFLFLAATSFLASSCSDADPEVFSSADGQIAYFTGGTSGDFYVQDIANPEALVEVGVTVASNVDRTIAVTVDPSSTATPNQYNIINSSLFIPANSYVGYIKVQGVYANTTTTGNELVLNLDSVSGAEIAGFNQQFTLSIYQFCPMVRDEFIGTYDVIEYDSAGAQADSYESNVSAGTAPNELILGNLYNFGAPDSETHIFLNDSNPSNFIIEFPGFLENFLLDGGPANGDIFIEGFPGKFSACTHKLDFSYRLRFGPGDDGASATATYRWVGVKQ